MNELTQLLKLRKKVVNRKQTFRDTWKNAPKELFPLGTRDPMVEGASKLSDMVFDVVISDIDDAITEMS